MKISFAFTFDGNSVSDQHFVHRPHNRSEVITNELQPMQCLVDAYELERPHMVHGAQFTYPCCFKVINLDVGQNDQISHLLV